MKSRRAPDNANRESFAFMPEVLASLEAGKPIRRDLPGGGRLHIDRPLPFICLHVLDDRQQVAARDVAAANASYLIAPDAASAAEMIERIAEIMSTRCGAFLLLQVGELEQDEIGKDAPYLPPFDIVIKAGDSAAEHAALEGFATAAEGREAKYRTPRVRRSTVSKGDEVVHLQAGIARLAVQFAPIYRVPGSDLVYPVLRERVVSNMLDAGLCAVSAFLKAKGIEAPASHRAFGRRVFVDAVTRTDRALDDVAGSFDFLLAVTPINSDMAWREFSAGGFQRAPRLLYRPLTFQIDAEKKKLFSISFDQLEDPVLSDLFRGKQQELDLQLSMIAARETPRFVAFGRALYGTVDPYLLALAQDILAATATRVAAKDGAKPVEGFVNCHGVHDAAAKMVQDYQAVHADFDATIEVRNDLPAGLMVVGSRLLISRETRVSKRRLPALLNHEIGVHLLTYFNGSAQGLRIFRSGLAGYEGMQEGLAVLAEYLCGGMTAARLRLLAARVVACEAMLSGANFAETFDLLVREHGFAEEAAFNLVLRVYRGGGLPKDAIYLKGLLDVLSHLEKGGSLTPFWMGKISAEHFAVMQELNARGLLRLPELEPPFLAYPGAEVRLKAARKGIRPVDMISD